MDTKKIISKIFTIFLQITVYNSSAIKLTKFDTVQ